MITKQILKVDIVFANCADPDKIPRSAAVHPGLHCLPLYPFRSSSLQAVVSLCFYNMPALIS